VGGRSGFESTNHSFEDCNAPTSSCEDGVVGDNIAFTSCISGIIGVGSYIKSMLILKDVSNQFIEGVQWLKNKMK
jgi:hypothetical protein